MIQFSLELVAEANNTLRRLKLFVPKLWKVCLALALGLGLALTLVAGVQTYAQSFAFIQDVRLINLEHRVTARNQLVTASGIITTQGNYLLLNGTHFEVRGVNYYPKDYAWDKFWENYTTTATSPFATQVITELDRAKALGINTVRIFVPYNHFNFNSVNQKYRNYLKDFVNNQLRPRNMVAIVTLFDFYPSYATNPYSSTDYLTSTNHISAVVNALGITNTNVLAWDIKNELDRDYQTYTKTKVIAWANQMISYTRHLDQNHL